MNNPRTTNGAAEYGILFGLGIGLVLASDWLSSWLTVATNELRPPLDSYVVNFWIATACLVVSITLLGISLVFQLARVTGHD